MPRRERHRAAVAEMEVAQQPARGRRPWQHAKGGGVRDHQHVGGAFHFLHAKAAAGREHRKHRTVRGVLGEHGRGDGAAALQRCQRFARDQGLAAQDAVLVGERKPDDFEILFFDDLAQAACRLFLLVRPQAVTFDETQRVSPPWPSLPRDAFRGRATASNPRCALAHRDSIAVASPRNDGATTITPPPTDDGSCRRSRSAPVRPTARRGGA